MFKKDTEQHFQSEASICTFNLLSSCTKGRNCPFLHDIPEEQYDIDSKLTGQKDPCYFFLKGNCRDGESCQRSHGEMPCFNGTIKKVCHYFSQGRCDRGKLCSYIHDLRYNCSVVKIIGDTQSSSCQPQNINVVDQVVINTSDDDQSKTVAPKFCHFYARGTCFFGDFCTKFHDKPVKDPVDLISELREDEALNERNSIDEIDSRDKSDKNSNDVSVVLTKRKELDLNILKIERGSSNRCNQRKSRKKASKQSSKSAELLKVPFDSSSKSKELFSVSYSSYAKSRELTKDLSMSKNSVELTKSLSSSSKSKEFVKVVNNSSHLKKFVRQTYSCPNSNEFFRESKISSKPKEFEKGTNSVSKSKEFADDTYFSNSGEFIRDSYNFTKSREFSKSIYTCYSQSKCVSNGAYSYTKSKEFFGAQYSSKQGGLSSSRYTDNLISKELPKNADVSLESKQFSRNSETLQEISKNSSNLSKLEEQSRNATISLNSMKQFEIAEDLRPIKAKEFSNIANKPSISNEQSAAESCNSKPKIQFTVTDGFNLRTEPRISYPGMTRKQSKSQRKLKSENIQSRIFFKRLFFKTPVTVTRVTKKL